MLSKLTDILAPLREMNMVLCQKLDGIHQELGAVRELLEEQRRQERWK